MSKVNCVFELMNLLLSRRDTHPTSHRETHRDLRNLVCICTCSRSEYFNVSMSEVPTLNIFPDHNKARDHMIIYPDFTLSHFTSWSLKIDSVRTKCFVATPAVCFLNQQRVCVSVCVCSTVSSFISGLHESNIWWAL